MARKEAVTLRARRLDKPLAWLVLWALLCALPASTGADSALVATFFPGGPVLLQAGGEAMLIGAGTGAGVGSLLADLASLGVASLKAVVEPSPGGGLPQVLRALEVEGLYLSPAPEALEAPCARYAAYLAWDRGIPMATLSQGDSLPLGDGEVRCLAATGGLVLTARLGSQLLVLAPGADAAAQAAALATGPLDAALLYAHAPSRPFLAATHPAWAVVGPDTPRAALDTLAALGADLRAAPVSFVSDGHRTDVVGVQSSRESRMNPRLSTVTYIKQPDSLSAACPRGVCEDDQATRCPDSGGHGGRGGDDPAPGGPGPCDGCVSDG